MARLAKSLVTLRDEVNAAAPGRKRASDGWLGDQAHAARASRHNPNAADVVTALDITHDPDGGVDIHAFARRHVANPHPDLEYIISNGQVARRSGDWEWRQYGGASPHTLHAHFAVGRGPDSEPREPYDTTSPWGFASAASQPPDQEEPDMRIVSSSPLGPDFYLITGGNIASLTSDDADLMKDSGIAHVVVSPAQIDKFRRDLFHSVDKGVAVRSVDG
jgi:hypothetical protein